MRTMMTIEGKKKRGRGEEEDKDVRGDSARE